jgi:hypothetical protein
VPGYLDYRSPVKTLFLDVPQFHMIATPIHKPLPMSTIKHLVPILRFFNSDTLMSNAELQDAIV